MGRRSDRKKTSEAKARDGFQNGQSYCPTSKSAVDASVCLVRQTRHRETCRGCERFRG